ncbi:endoplasmic reticulum metallopeptidase 1 [Nilaparvata lugens]|uniref:endoplasmic reticulum metallopeptidase 1 n=1 Tax=Nilaparvata lugens TaxID=108931 RepID=UPI00193D4833|nr:endoplasmic reticulum metallopeptidase 1 [Nilaparvata lugens]
MPLLCGVYCQNLERSERSEIRYRAKLRHESLLPKHYPDQKHAFRTLLPASTLCYLTILVSFVLIFVIIEQLEKQLPPPLMVKDEPANPHRFIAERAKNHVVNLTSLGPRPTGSFENEVLAVNFLSKEINYIISRAKKVHRIVLDVQKVSGSFPLSFLDGMTSVYRNVQNVVVRISGVQESAHSLLINCHFDTVTDSPGGSDDGASCAVMLEMLRVMSQRDAALPHNVVLLFNGAEENLLQASHGFITQHRWASEVRAFVNLESCGAGGREILFQAGPEHPWLMQAYAETVPYPLASSLAQEVFESGIIPGDTDFRIFRDFGHISGLDFAWVTNGYVYHTRLDNAAQIPLGTLQRTGDNILSLTLKLASADQLVPSSSQSAAAGKIIFFDVIGAFIVYWSELVGNLLNVAVLAFSIYTLNFNINKSVSEDIVKQLYMRQMFLCTGVIVCGWVLSLLTCGLTAFTLTMLNRAMSWFARPVWIFFLYIIPSLLVPLLVTLLAARRQRLVIRSPWTLFRLYCDANQILYTTMTLICLLFRIRSGFIPAMWLFFSCISSVLRERIFAHWKDWRILVLYVGCLVLPYIECAYIINGSLQLIIPIMGRSGSGNHAEIVLGMISSAMFTLLLSFLVPGILLVQIPKRVVSFLSAIFFIAILVLILTPLGFPYSSDPAAPAPQRHMILHVERTFHGVGGEVEEQRAGFWVINLDVNSPRSVSSLVPEMARAQVIDEDCDKRLYCGLPYIIPVMTFIWQTHWIPGPSPIISIPTELTLLQREVRPQNIHRLTFEAVGPDHMTLLVSPRDGMELIGWSVDASKPLAGPKWHGRNTYFVYYSCASDPEPWRFYIDFKVRPYKIA